MRRPATSLYVLLASLLLVHARENDCAGMINPHVTCELLVLSKTAPRDPITVRPKQIIAGWSRHMTADTYSLDSVNSVLNCSLPAQWEARNVDARLWGIITRDGKGGNFGIAMYGYRRMGLLLSSLQRFSGPGLQDYVVCRAWHWKLDQAMDPGGGWRVANLGDARRCYCHPGA